MKPSDVRDAPPRVVPPTASASPRLHSVALDADRPDTGRVARRAARRIVSEWCLPVPADDVELAVSELVGNAVHHATRYDPRGRVTVVFRSWSRWLLVEVADESPVPPTFPTGATESVLAPAPAGLAEGGRGLFLVGCLADGVWWSSRETGGKSVFCRFRFQPAQPVHPAQPAQPVHPAQPAQPVQPAQEAP